MEGNKKSDGWMERSKDTVKARAKSRDISKRKNKRHIETKKEREVGVLLSGCFNTPFIG